MAQINAKDVKNLREKTGAGMMDCKKALVESDGNIEKAVKYLREKGIAKAAKKASRTAKEGIVECYIHGNKKLGVMIELNCETDFVARNDKFTALARDIAMHVAAASPKYVSSDQVPAENIEKEKELMRAQLVNEGKPAQVIDKIIEGKIKKYCKEICLLDQEYVKDPDKTVGQLLTDSVGVIGENIQVGRFQIFNVGQ